MAIAQRGHDWLDNMLTLRDAHGTRRRGYTLINADQKWSPSAFIRDNPRPELPAGCPVASAVVGLAVGGHHESGVTGVGDETALRITHKG
ncbi:MAG: hypothetical protein GY842_08615 [bacterium]|nr:hypothetical protein [bacterium]